MYFDTHAHYDSLRFDGDRKELLSGLAEAGVELVVNPGCDLSSSRKAVAIAEEWPFVYAAVGVHPEYCLSWQEGDLEELRALAAHPKVLAIGEIGLDYHWEPVAPREIQHKIFREQLALAEELELPVIIHDRQAHGDTLATLKEFPHVRGVFHCYSGSAEMARELVKLGWMISFTGVITYENARQPIEAAAAVPLENLMIETDAPYLTPYPFRKKRNHSGYLHLTCESLARIKGISPEECARITLENGKRFFSIPDGATP